MKDEYLTQILCSLLKKKILISDEINEDFQETDIEKDIKIQLNSQFKSERIRINLNVGFKLKKNEDLNKKIDGDRKLMIQAAIVQIMKERKSLKHSLLIAKVIDKKLNSRFKPQVALIKKNIDALIEKEYLGRDSNDKDLLIYLA